MILVIRHFGTEKKHRIENRSVDARDRRYNIILTTKGNNRTLERARILL